MQPFWPFTKCWHIKSSDDNVHSFMTAWFWENPIKIANKAVTERTDNFMYTSIKRVK